MSSPTRTPPPPEDPDSPERLVNFSSTTPTTAGTSSSSDSMASADPITASALVTPPRLISASISIPGRIGANQMACDPFPLASTPHTGEIEPIPAFVATKQSRRDLYRKRSYSCAARPRITVRETLARLNAPHTQPAPSPVISTGNLTATATATASSGIRSKRSRPRTLSNEHLVTKDIFDDDVLLDHHASPTPSPVAGSTSVPTADLADLEATRDTARQNLSSTFTASGRPNVVASGKYESLDYDQCENMLQIEETTAFTRNGDDKNLEITRWMLIMIIGAFTGLTACFILFSVEQLTRFKYTKIMHLFEGIDSNPNRWTLLKPYLVWIFANGFPTLMGSLLVTYLAPVAAGSGIPVIKCYLNGVKVPEVVRIKTYFAKAVGVIASVTGGLACGKEGPMIHCGACIAAGVSQGKSTTFKMDFKRWVGLTRFREDHEKRDFVSAGAAAGVAAAFGAPLGGVLFALEEGASFWNQLLVVRIFFCSLISSFSLNVIVSFVHNEKLGAPGLLNFGKFQDIDYSAFEMPIYVGMGVFGGLTGAAWNYLNMKITILRMRYLKSSWSKILEAVLASMITASIGFAMIILLGDCYSPKTEETEYPVGYGCPKGQHNVMAALWFNTPEATLKNLFHNKDGTWEAQTLSVFVIIYFFVACLTYGLSVSAGLFIPCLLLGAAWGRLFGLVLSHLFPDQAWINPGKFALIGASASLGGIVRMTISLTVIIIETTGNLSFGLPIMVTVIIAKWIGDLFTEGVYDIHIALSRVPFLNWEPPSDSSRIYASEVMHTPVVSLRTTETVRRIVETLSSTTHNGFPVVDAETSWSHVRTYGRYRGLILRSQLLIMLAQKIFNETSFGDRDADNSPGQGQSPSEITWSQAADSATAAQPKPTTTTPPKSSYKYLQHVFRDFYPRAPKLESIIADLKPNELNYTLDLRPVMNPSAYTVCHAASFNRIFRLFRALGLRHIVVLNDYNEVVGIVTRKDLVHYCEGRH